MSISQKTKHRVSQLNMTTECMQKLHFKFEINEHLS